MSKHKSKPKPKQRSIWSAFQIETHINSKFSTQNDKFWEWFFSETPFGEINSINFDEIKDYAPIEFHPYLDILRDEFDDPNIVDFEIENDL